MHATSKSSNGLERDLLRRWDWLHGFIAQRIPARLRRTVDPDDILQDVWIRAFRALATRPISGADLDRWLIRASRRSLTDALRYATRKRRGGLGQVAFAAANSSFDNLFERIAGTGRSPSSEDAINEAVTAVRSALGRLPEVYREVLSLRHLSGKPIDTIALITNRTTGAVNSILFRGKRMLRDQLGPAGLYFSDPSDDRSNHVSPSGH